MKLLELLKKAFGIYKKGHDAGLWQQGQGGGTKPEKVGPLSGGTRKFVVLLALGLLGGCAGLDIARNCRFGIVDCPAGQTCQPEGDGTLGQCVPDASPSPTPSPEPTHAPSPSPAASPSPLPTPTPTPTATPTPAPAPTPKPPKCESTATCRTCDDVIAQAIEWGNWNCPRTQGWPDRGLDTVREDGTPTPREPYDASKGRGMCYNRGDRPARIDRQCNQWRLDADVMTHPWHDGSLGVICDCSPKPEPSPTPTPGPTPTPWPIPSPGATPPSNDATLFRIGVKLHDIQDKGKPGPKTQGGKRYIFNTTPKSVRPWCEHTAEVALWASYKSGDHGAFGHELTPAEEAVYRAKEATGTLSLEQRVECEQLPARQDPRGPKGYQTLPGRFVNDELEQSSVNPYLMQIRITDPAEAGIYTIRVCPYDDPITSSRCSEWVGDVKP